MKTGKSILLIVLAWTVFPGDAVAFGPMPQETDRKNTVILMGMIHSGHRQHEIYNLERVKSLIRKVNPDYVLTEIPPDRLATAVTQFRQTGKVDEPRVRVFPEYTEALFPLTREMDFEVIPCAAWTREMADSRRKTLTRLKTTHAQEYAEMEEAQGRASQNIAKLGNPNDPAVIHTEQYDGFVKEGMRPYDGHFNEIIGDGGWENINAAHYGLIEQALDSHQGEGKTFLVTFGSWHKYYFKEQLRKRTDIQLVSLLQFLNQQDQVDLDKLLAEFRNAWDEANWVQEFRGTTYMRATGDDQWKTRMTTIQALVRAGEQAVPALEKHLENEHTPTRILAAQAISYLARHADINKLQQLFRNEPDPAVRLYLVDALGMSGQGSDVDWPALVENEENRDVLKHIGYARERKDSAVPDSIIETLVNWDSETIDAVKVGESAPDFVLSSVDGTEIRLSDFRGKQPVVLVFVYGDT